MNVLAGLQRRFMASIVRPGDTVAGDLRADAGIDPALGLGIYSFAYQARLREVLGNDHAVLARYLGDGLWDRLCVDYISWHPSRHRSLRQFGDALPGFLVKHSSFKAHPEIAELANFERSLLDCFDSPDAPVATWEALLEFPADRWPALRPQFSPAVRRLSMASNAVAIWSALKADAAPPLARMEPSQWLCWRDADLVTQFRSMDAEEAALIDHFFTEGDFSGACESLLAGRPAMEVPSHALAYLQRWAEAGLVSNWA